MSVKYNGNCLIPGPFAGIDKSYQRTGAGNVIGSEFTITLTGKLFPDRGSPSASGDWYTDDAYPANEPTTDNFGALLHKQELLRDLFSNDGQLLQFKSCADVTLSCYPTTAIVSFPDQQHYQYTDYTITLTAPFISGLLVEDDFSEYISSATETWGLETTDIYEGPELDVTSRLTHSVNAVGKKVYNGTGAISEGWEQAREWVLPRLGLDTVYLNGTSGLNLPAYYTGYDYIRTENTDELGGSYDVTETWTISSGSAIEEFSISVNTSQDSYIDRVSAEGNIRGLEERSSDYYTVSNNKWTNALAKYTNLIGSSDINTIYNRARDYSGYSNLNPQPLSTVVGKNPTNGTINYTYDYDTRATNYVSGAKFETISVSNTYPTDVYGEVFALGRVGGPVLQDLGTVTKASRALAVDVVMQPYSGVNSLTTQAGITALFANNPKTQVDELVDAFQADLASTYSQVFTDGDTDDWDVRTGRYTRNVSWSYGQCSGVV